MRDAEFFELVIAAECVKAADIEGRIFSKDDLFNVCKLYAAATWQDTGGSIFSQCT